MNKLGKAIVCAAAAVAVLAGCSTTAGNTETTAKADYKSRFVTVCEFSNNCACVICDTETGVQYLHFYNGGITPLINADGTPRVYKEDNKND